MADDLDFDEFDFEDDLGDDSFSVDPGEPAGSRNPVDRLARQTLEGAIGSATDNQMIKAKVKDALPQSMQDNWETADDLIDVADRAKDNIVNPIRKEMVSFKRNMNKLTPLVKRYFGEGIADRYNNLTETRAESESVDPDQQELLTTVGGIFSEEAKARLEAEDKKLVLDMMDRRTEEDRFKLQMTTIHDILGATKRMDEFNRSIQYAFQQKSLEYDIKRFHLLKQILDVNKTVGESSVGHLQAIVHNTSLPELVKQQNSELFQQMFIEKWYGESLDNVMGMGRTMMRNFGRNIMGRASRTAESIVDSMRSVGEMADMVGSMSDGMEDESETPADPKQAIIDGLAKAGGSGIIKSGMDKIIAELITANQDKDWFKNMVAQSDNISSNQNLFFKTFIDDMANQNEGWKRFLAPIFKIAQEELPDMKRGMTSIGHLNSFKPTDPRQWDHAQRTSVVEIIPGWLERIHNLIAELLNKDERLAYDTKAGDFIDRRAIQQEILDAIITDEERADALKEVDSLIDKLTNGISGVGEDERNLMREWLIREASTTPNLDIRGLLNAESYKDLSTYDETLANRVSGAFAERYNTDTLYRANTTSLKDVDDNRHIAKVGKDFHRVVRKYSDDQEVLNTAITGGRRSVLRELGILTDDGEINETTILRHKLMGITPDGGSPSLDEGLGDIVNRALNPTEPPEGPKDPKQTPPSIIPPNVRPANTMAPNTDIPSGTPPNAPLIQMPELDLSNLVTSDNFNDRIEEAIAELKGIRSNTTPKLPGGLGINAGVSGVISPRVIESGEEHERVVRDYLGGILSTLATMHAANIDYYQNVKEFELGNHGLVSKVKRLIGGWGEKIGAGASFLKGRLSGMFRMGNMSLAAIREGFVNNFSSGGADVYVGDEDSPRITVRDFRDRPMFLKLDGEIQTDRIRKPEDIKGAVVDENGLVIITQEEYDEGLVTFNRDGMFKKLGGMFGKIANFGLDTLTGGSNMVHAGFKLGMKFAKGAGDAIYNTFLRFKDTYILDEDGKVKLLATVDDFKNGKLRVEIDGEFHVVKDMKDLLKGNIYRINDEGIPEVVATVDQIKRGLCDVMGRSIELGGNALSSAMELAKKGWNGAVGMAKLPFTVFGNMWGAIKAKFESRMLDKIVLNIPKDILISANVVYLNDRGRGYDPRKDPKPDAPKDDSNTVPKDTSVFSLSKIRGVKPDEKDEDLTVERSSFKKIVTENVEERYNKLVNSKRVVRAKAFFDRATEDPEVLKELIREAWNKHVASEETPLSKEEFTIVYLKEKFETKWKDKLESIDEAGGLRNFVSNSEAVADIKRDVSEKGVLGTIKDRTKETKVFKAIQDKIRGAESRDEISEIINGAESAKGENESLNEAVERSDTISTIKELIERNEKLSSIKETILNNSTIKSIIEKVDHADDGSDESTKSSSDKLRAIGKNLGINDLLTEDSKVGQLISNSSLMKRLKSGVAPTEPGQFNRTYDKLKSYGKDDEAKEYFEKLIDDPDTLRDVVDDAWARHLAAEDDPMDKETFERHFIEDKFDLNADRAKEALENDGKTPLSVNSKREGFVEKMRAIGHRVSSGIPGISVEADSDAKKAGLDKPADPEQVTQVDKEEVDRSIKNPVGDLVTLMRNKFIKDDKDSRPKKDDSDNDGIRDNSWRDILKKRAEKRRLKAEAAKEPSGKKEKGGKDDKSLMGYLIAGLGAVTAGIGKLIGGVMSIPKHLFKFGKVFVKDIAKGIWQVGQPILRTLMMGAGNVLGAINRKGGALISRGIQAAAPIVSAATKRVATSAAVQVGRFAATRIGAAALASLTPIGWVLGVAAAGYMVWEASSAVFGWFKRREDIKMMEYLRHLEYGVISGDLGPHLDNKVSIRYFEDKLVGEAVVKDGMVSIGMTTEEVWEEFRDEFKDDGDDVNAAGFKRWYEGRFLPVFYKWMSLCASFNDAYKAATGTKRDLALQILDDKLPRDLKVGFARQSLDYSTLSHDPLEIMASPSTAVVVTTNRVDSESFVRKIEEYIRGKKVDSARPQTAAEKEVVREKIKQDAYKAMSPAATRKSKWQYGAYDSGASRNSKWQPSPYSITPRATGGFDLKEKDLSAAKDKNYIEYIKDKEGFSDTAYWDVSQYSIGYGTKTDHRPEQTGDVKISEKEATKRLVNWTNKDRAYITKKGEEEGLTWSEKELDALTSFTYNLGRGNFSKLIKGRNKDEIAAAMPKYSLVDGRRNAAILQRRQEEVELFKSAGNTGPNPKTKSDKDQVPADRDGPKSPKADAAPQNQYSKAPVNPVVKAPPSPRKSTPVTAKDAGIKVVDETKTVVDLSGMPSNEGIESSLQDTNKISSQQLAAQNRTNELMEKFMSATYANRGMSAPASAMEAQVKETSSTPPKVTTVVPSAPPRVNNSPQFK